MADTEPNTTSPTSNEILQKAKTRRKSVVRTDPQVTSARGNEISKQGLENINDKYAAKTNEPSRNKEHNVGGKSAPWMDLTVLHYKDVKSRKKTARETMETEVQRDLKRNQNTSVTSEVI